VTVTSRTIEVETAGRTDLEDFFRMSGVLSASTLNHSPILAFVADEHRVTVRILTSAKEAVALPSDTPLMAQWPGRWRSDFFRFTAGELRAADVKAA
jgi:hypothetical protein